MTTSSAQAGPSQNLKTWEEMVDVPRDSTTVLRGAVDFLTLDRPYHEFCQSVVQRLFSDPASHLFEFCKCDHNENGDVNSLEGRTGHCKVFQADETQTVLHDIVAIRTVKGVLPVGRPRNFEDFQTRQPRA